MKASNNKEDFNKTRAVIKRRIKEGNRQDSINNAAQNATYANAPDAAAGTGVWTKKSGKHHNND